MFHNSSRTSDFQSYTWDPDLGFDRSNTLVNRPQIFVANAIYYLPSLKGSNSFVQATVGGWELAVISQYSSGASSTLYQYWFTDLANGNTVGLIGTGNPQARPLATAIPCKGVGGPEVLNPDSVSVIGYQIGTIPNGIEPHGYCRRPGYVNTDFSVDKNWRMWHEKLRLQFRLDFFNLFNHPNFRGDFIDGRRVYRSSMSDRRTSGPCLGRRSRASLPRIATGGFEDGVAWIEQLRTARNVFSYPRRHLRLCDRCDYGLPSRRVPIGC